MTASPRRSCVVCRAVDEPKNLLRFVVKDNELTVDFDGSMSGRGAYCHREGQCIGHPKLADALVGSLTRRAKGLKVGVGRALEQLRPSSSDEVKKNRKQQSKKIRL